MNFNALIQTERPPISSLVSGLRTGGLFVDDTFQRKLVWTERQKIRLIETILMGFPMPEIYLWQQTADAESGEQKRSIVDGQQRLTTMRQFVSNEWSLKKASLDASNRNSEFAGVYWKDLDDGYKKIFWDYVVNVRVIPNQIELDGIIDIFKRLNETDKSLNPQEIRNAEFNGKLITAAEEITEHRFWSDFEVFSASQIRRMLDIEFASSLLVFLRRGSVQENNKLLNEMYDLYNDKYVERATDIRKVFSFLDWLADLLERRPELESIFSKPVHIFTLFSVCEILDARRSFPQEGVEEKLVSFVREYEKSNSTDPNIVEYREGARARTRSKSSREARSTGLLKWLSK
ncbi:hypothetical protein GCM10011342_28440 [Aquisalinus flavus]|uniref:GmrSD restriction endonucleases N-terminal domain-containing protein n=2 Tax=Aquisalinus flavus TaxID=1526572 RepID=A0A8J2V417_9PROT|nr:hypothetical protein GCM10011342_28440 [Aquisalinus flavus]